MRRTDTGISQHFQLYSFQLKNLPCLINALILQNFLLHDQLSCMSYLSLPSSIFHIDNFVQLEGVRPSRVLITPSQVRITIITTRKMRWRALISLMSMQTLSHKKGKYTQCVFNFAFLHISDKRFWIPSYEVVSKYFVFVILLLLYFQGS